MLQAIVEEGLAQTVADLVNLDESDIRNLRVDRACKDKLASEVRIPSPRSGAMISMREHRTPDSEHDHAHVQTPPIS